MRPAALHSRIDLACEQLDIAIELFFSERSFVSSLTLAGAAEEVFGVELKNRNGQSTLARRYAVRQRLHERLNENRRLYPSVNLKAQTWKEFTEKENYARNAAKHIADKRQQRSYDPFFRAEPRSESVNMILRAMHNQELLGLPRSELAHRFYGWYMSSVYGDEASET